MLAAFNRLRRISLTLAARNDHMGARHSVEEELPRIRWTNSFDIAVHKVPKTRDDVWAPQATVEFLRVGRKGRDDVDERHVQQVVDELKDLGGR